MKAFASTLLRSRTLSTTFGSKPKPLVDANDDTRCAYRPSERHAAKEAARPSSDTFGQRMDAHGSGQIDESTAISTETEALEAAGLSE